MNPINNSDLAWLIVSDYNQDNNKFYEELIEDILNPETNRWEMEHSSSYADVGAGLNSMAFSIYESVFPGDHVHGEIHAHVGDQRADMAGYGQFSSRVGGIYATDQ